MSGKKDRTSWDAIGSAASSVKRKITKAIKSRKQSQARSSKSVRKAARTRR